MNLNFYEKIAKAFAEGSPLQLKGHTKITLTDVDTGEEKVYEDENMITNAVNNILQKNYSMTMDITKLTPIYKLFAGVLCFENNLAESTSNVLVPCNTDNALIAHAGDEPHNTASRLRGNPNGGDSEVGVDHVKFAWDWAPNQGNGDISAVALTSNVCGNAGLMPFDGTYYGVNCDVSTRAIRNVGESLDATNIVKYPMIYKDGSHAYAFSIVDRDGDPALEEITVAHDFLTFGLTMNITDFTRGTSRYAVVRSSNPFIFVDDSYYYAVARTSSTTLQVDKISRSDMSVTTADITLQAESFAEINPGTDVRRFTTIPFEPGYLYWPKTGLYTFYRINLANTADVVELTSHLGSDATLVLQQSGASSLTDAINRAEGWAKVGEHMIIGTNYIINDTGIYPCKGFKRSDYNDSYMPNIMLLNGGDNTAWGTMKHYTQGRYSYSGMCLNYYYLATINNLSESVTKEQNQTMRIEYTITEA